MLLRLQNEFMHIKNCLEFNSFNKINRLIQIKVFLFRTFGRINQQNQN